MRTYSTELKNYTATHFEKASVFDNMKAKDKEDLAEILKKLNELATFLKQQPTPPITSNKGIANSTIVNSNKSKYLRTPKQNPNAIQVGGGEVIYVKARNPPKPKPDIDSKTNNKGKVNVKPPAPDFGKPVNDILVKRQVVKNNMTAVAIAVQVEDIDRSRHDGRIDIQFIEYDDNPSHVIPQFDVDEQKASIHINSATAYYKKIEGTPQFWRSLTPLVAEGFTSIKYMASRREQVEPTEFLREVGKTFSAIWGVFK